MNKIQSILIAASLSLAMAFTLSCSSDSGGGDNSNGTGGGKKFTDSRDGRSYKYVEIGEQTWMAENLNYNASGSKCYDNDSENCKKYGRLYDWATAMGFEKECNSSSSCRGQVQEKHKGICPQGWHMPSDEEWTVLTDFVGDGSATKLRATSGWDADYITTLVCDAYASAGISGYCKGGTDEYGFSALPGGYCYFSDSGEFVFRSSTAVTSGSGGGGGWWSTGEGGDGYWHLSNVYVIIYIYENTFLDDNLKTSLYSVRCVKD